MRYIRLLLFSCITVSFGCSSAPEQPSSAFQIDTFDVQTTALQNQSGVASTEERGMIRLAVADSTYEKRFVLRYPEEQSAWNGRLLVGAHGGSGGKLYTRDGTVTGTSETALDDVIGDYALAQGYVYASVDRDGIGGTREGQKLTDVFTDQMKKRVQAVYGQAAEYVYLAGLSAGGAVTRYASEDTAPKYDGALIIVGGGGGTPPQLDRQIRMALLWPDVDPVKHPDRPLTDARIKEYAELIGTPAEARRFWSFVGARQTLAGFRRTVEGLGLTDLTDNQLKKFQLKDFEYRTVFMKRVEAARAQATKGKITMPVIEVNGTYDDIVNAGIRTYKEKIRRQGREDRHRLYQVDGAWHISSDDDAIGTFQYFMKQMGIGKEAQDQLATGTTYRPTVEQALDYLDRWVTTGEVPPPDHTVKRQ